VIVGVGVDVGVGDGVGVGSFGSWLSIRLKVSPLLLIRMALTAPLE
jgi:hypothetical protein